MQSTLSTDYRCPTLRCHNMIVSYWSWNGGITMREINVKYKNNNDYSVQNDSGTEQVGKREKESNAKNLKRRRTLKTHVIQAPFRQLPSCSAGEINSSLTTKCFKVPRGGRETEGKAVGWKTDNERCTSAQDALNRLTTSDDCFRSRRL